MCVCVCVFIIEWQTNFQLIKVIENKNVFELKKNKLKRIKKKHWFMNPQLCFDGSVKRYKRLWLTTRAQYFPHCAPFPCKKTLQLSRQYRNFKPPTKLVNWYRRHPLLDPFPQQVLLSFVVSIHCVINIFAMKILSNFSRIAHCKSYVFTKWTES